MPRLKLRGRVEDIDSLGHLEKELIEKRKAMPIRPKKPRVSLCIHYKSGACPNPKKCDGYGRVKRKQGMTDSVCTSYDTR